MLPASASSSFAPDRRRRATASCVVCGNHTTFVFRDGAIGLSLTGTEAAEVSNRSNISCGKCHTPTPTIVQPEA